MKLYLLCHPDPPEAEKCEAFDELIKNQLSPSQGSATHSLSVIPDPREARLRDLIVVEVERFKEDLCTLLSGLRVEMLRTPLKLFQPLAN